MDRSCSGAIATPASCSARSCSCAGLPTSAPARRRSGPVEPRLVGVSRGGNETLRRNRGEALHPGLLLPSTRATVMNVDSFTRLLEVLPALEPWGAVLACVSAAIFCLRRAFLRLVETACGAIDRRGEDRSRDREVLRFEVMSDTAYRRDREMEILRLDRARTGRHSGKSGCTADELGCAGLDRCREP